MTPSMPISVLQLKERFTVPKRNCNVFLSPHSTTFNVTTGGFAFLTNAGTTSTAGTVAAMIVMPVDSSIASSNELSQSAHVSSQTVTTLDPITALA